MSGAIIGLLLAVLIQPYATAFMTDIYVRADAPTYAAPPIDIEVNNQNVSYQEGKTVPDFGGMEWKSEYEVHRYDFQNQGNNKISKLKLIIQHPGCIVHSNTKGPSVGGQVTVKNTFSYRVSGDLATLSRDNSKLDVYHCTKTVVMRDILPKEERSFEFVVTQKFDQCDYLVAFSPDEKVQVRYKWPERGKIYSERTSIKMSGMPIEYQQSRNLPYTATRARLVGEDGPTTSNYLIGVNVDRINDGLAACYHLNESASTG